MKSLPGGLYAQIISESYDPPVVVITGRRSKTVKIPRHMVGKGRLVIFKYKPQNMWVDFVGVFNSYTYETDEGNKFLRVTVYIEHVRARNGKEWDAIRVDEELVYKLYTAQECKNAGVEKYIPVPDSPYCHVPSGDDRDKIERCISAQENFVKLAHKKYGDQYVFDHFLDVETTDIGGDVFKFWCLVGTPTNEPIEIDGYRIVNEEIRRAGGYSDAGYFFDFDSPDPDYNPCL